MRRWDDDDTAFAELLARARRGDRVAAVRILDPHRERIFVIVRSIVRWKDGEREVFHELIVRADRILTTYRPERGALGPYIYRVARNEALAVVRRQTERHLSLDDLTLAEEPTADVDDPERHALASLELIEVLASLTEDDVIVLRTCLGWMTDEEAARHLTMTPEGVRTRRTRLRRRLAARTMREGHDD